jgi:hypothetical protein
MTALPRRAALLGLATGTLCVGLPALIAPSLAHASVARALSLRDLSRGSGRIIRGVPQDKYAQWETHGGRRRIVTYTRVLVSEDLGRTDRESEVLVMTWGGRVDGIAQLVHGEAALGTQQDCVLFLSKPVAGVRRVTAMAQGHYLVEREGQKDFRLRRSPQLDALIGARDSAVDRLHHRSLNEATRMIQGELE